MSPLRLVELPQKIEQPVEGAPGVCVFVTHVARAPSGLPRVRASLWHGAFVANGVLEPDVETDRWRFARAAAAQAPEAVPEPKALVAALMRCAESLHQQRVLETVDALVAAEGADDAPGRPSQATRLVAMAEEGGAVLFHSPDGEPYASVPVADPGTGADAIQNGADGACAGQHGTHVETWALRSRGFRRWLARRHYQETRGAAGGQALQDALGVLEGRALYDGEECPVAVRLAEAGGAVYLDLADPTWRVVRVAPDEPGGWRVLAPDEATAAPVRFRRPRGVLALPQPAPGGAVDELRAFVNAPDDDRWRLLVAWLAAALRPRGPYPALALSGEQGAAKSTAARVLRALVDPNAAPLRAQPREPRDLMIAAANGWVVAFDNLSAVPVWLSDALCRLATGRGLAVRELFSDAEETLFDAQRPVLFTGIEELATRGDLLDRSLVVTLPAIPEEARRTEGELWPAFDKARPRILGALLAAVAAGLSRLPDTRLDRLPRMADFALWVSAAEPSLWPAPGAFLRAYAGNRADARETALDASPLVPALRTVVAEAPGGRWEGTATELHRRLSEGVDERTLKAEGWPKTGQALGGALRRLAPDLRATGLDVEVGKKGRHGAGRKRLVVLRALAPEPAATSDPGAPGASTGLPASREGSFRTEGIQSVPAVPAVPPSQPPGVDGPEERDGCGTAAVARESTAVPPPPGERDGWDGWDGSVPHHSYSPLTDPAGPANDSDAADDAADAEDF